MVQIRADACETGRLTSKDAKPSILTSCSLLACERKDAAPLLLGESGRPRQGSPNSNYRSTSCSQMHETLSSSSLSRGARRL